MTELMIALNVLILKLNGKAAAVAARNMPHREVRMGLNYFASGMLDPEMHELIRSMYEKHGLKFTLTCLYGQTAKEYQGALAELWGKHVEALRGKPRLRTVAR